MVEVSVIVGPDEEGRNMVNLSLLRRIFEYMENHVTGLLTCSTEKM